jgi:zinc D-Ala-D-Ala carboxypeptidase
MAADGYRGAATIAYRRRIEKIARELEIPADYGRVRQLSLQVEAEDLVSIGANPDGAEVKLTPPAAGAWQQMRAAAAEAGHLLVPISGYRSVDRQIEIIRAKRAAGNPIGEILQWVAAPGYSEHHTGRAIDLGAPDEPPLATGFSQIPAFRWLESHGAEFQFRLSFPPDNRHGIGFEPWHWLYLG